MLIPAVWLGHLVFAPHCLNFTQRCEEHGQTELRLRRMKAFDVRVCHLAFHVVFPRLYSDVGDLLPIHRVSMYCTLHCSSLQKMTLLFFNSLHTG